MTENLTTFEMLVSSALLSAPSDVLNRNTNATISFLLNTTTAPDTTKSKTKDATPTDTDIDQDGSGNFILIPFAVLLFIVALSALVFLIGRNRSRIARFYYRRRNEHKYSFEEDSDSTMERGGDNDFDDPSECLLKGKLQIDNLYSQSYASTLRKELYT